MSADLNQSFYCETVPPELMDQLWAAGWRHFGEMFFRYSSTVNADQEQTITPLRLDLQAFQISKSQRRVMRRNADLRCEFAPARLSDEARAMFQRHKNRFKDNVPDDLANFLSATPATCPSPCLECQVYEGDSLIALSFLDLGSQATSAVYGMFEPEHSWRSLGLFTMLSEIQFSLERGCRYYYPGYATVEPSAYDYKKRFSGLEILNWATGEWEKAAPRAPTE